MYETTDEMQALERTVRDRIMVFKARLSRSKMRENLGQNEIREINDLIGGNIYHRNSMGGLVFCEMLQEFESWVDAL